MTVTIVRARPDPSVIKNNWLRERVRSLLQNDESDRNGLTTLINIERQFGGADIEYLFQLRAWMNEHERRSNDPGLPDTATRTYDVE